MNAQHSTLNAQRLIAAAERLTARLVERDRRIVFAESCTAGLVAASLARVPGISEHLCGSAVVYRNATKTAWLGVSANTLADEQIGPVSAEVAAAMAEGVLARTPEADIALSVTGHLGPDAPLKLDGLIYVGVATRLPFVEGSDAATTLEAHLSTQAPGDELRVSRQQQAAAIVLERAAQVLSSPGA